MCQSTIQGKTQPVLFAEKSWAAQGSAQELIKVEHEPKGDTPRKGDQLVEPNVVDALRKVIQNRRLTKEFVETDEFGRILAGLRETVLKGSSLDVWSSLSIAGRAASVSKPMENVFVPIVGQRVDAGLPSFEALQDGEDRWYLAKALQRNPSPDVVEIAFSEIVRDDLGEKARRVWVEIALAAAETRDEFLKRIEQECRSPVWIGT